MIMDHQWIYQWSICGLPGTVSTLCYLYSATSVSERWPEPVDTDSSVAAVRCGSSKRSRCKLVRQSVLGSDNETRAIYRQRTIICQPASNLAPDFNNHLGCGVGRAAELSLRQQQLQKHRPPLIPATISCFPKSGQEAPSQQDFGIRTCGGVHV